MRGLRSDARGVAALVPLAVAALLLAACSGDDPAPAPSTPAVAEEPAEEPTPSPDGPPEEEPSSAGAACVQGTWMSDAVAQAEQATAALGMAELGAQATVAGRARTTIEGTTLTTEYLDQVVEVSWDLQGQQYRMVNAWSGTLTATVEVTDDRLVVTDVDLSGLTATFETYVDGQRLAVPGVEEVPLSGFAAGGASTYTCTADQLRLVPEVAGIDADAVATVLLRER